MALLVILDNLVHWETLAKLEALDLKDQLVLRDPRDQLVTREFQEHQVREGYLDLLDSQVCQVSLGQKVNLDFKVLQDHRVCREAKETKVPLVMQVHKDRRAYLDFRVQLVLSDLPEGQDLLE